ncbi:MAG: substrate-binding domain-containing protein [Rhodospirillaceae bacterium]|nr:substrate-binding domain-containing protein [Rhodospirillales bacterium]
MTLNLSRRTILGGAAAGLTLAAAGGTAYRLMQQPPHKNWLLTAGAALMEVMTRQLADAFSLKHPGVGIVMDIGGSTSGLTALKRGAIDIACMARDLDMQHEDAAPTRAWIVAKDCLAIVVHPSNPLGNLPAHMVRDLFAGRQMRWPGSLNVPVEVVQRPQTQSSNQISFNSLVMHHTAASDNSIIAGTNSDMLREVSQRRGAIGFLPMRLLNDTVKALAVDSIEIKAKTVLSGRYPYARPLFYVTHGPANEQTARFIAFARSDEGQELLTNMGLVRVA